jgi:branched-chain amino acid transport system permease protein
MSAQPAKAEVAESTDSLRQLWHAGPAGWNRALTRARVLVPFFLAALAVPLVLQYVEDNSSWIGAQYWTLILATCAMYACLAVALNLVVGYAGLLNLGFIAFFGIGSYAYALVASDQIHQHYPLWAAVLVVSIVTLAFALLVGVPALRLRGDYLAIVTLAFGLIMRDVVLELDRPPVLAGHQFGPDGLNITGGTNGIHQVQPFNLPTCPCSDRCPITGCTTGSSLGSWRSASTSCFAGEAPEPAAPGSRSAMTNWRRGRWASTPSSTGYWPSRRAP